jgi:hypothetical protein
VTESLLPVAIAIVVALVHTATSWSLGHNTEDRPMWIPERDTRRLVDHAYLDDDGIVKCNKTYNPINFAIVRRSIWWHRTGGSGKVRDVLHLACMACNPCATPPRQGEPIREHDLTQMHGLSPA